MRPLEGFMCIYSNPEFVFIDEAALKRIAGGVAKLPLTVPDWRFSDVLPAIDDEKFVQFVGVVTSVNFAFTNFKPPHSKFEIDWKGRKFQGSLALGASFMRAIEEGIPVLNARYLRLLDRAELEYIFRGTNPIPLLKERLEILRQLGNVLLERYDGGFLNLFKKADFRAFSRSVMDIGIIERLFTDFLGYWDSSYHSGSGKILRFNKKARLCAIIYQGRALSSGGKLPLIKDAHELGPPADYRLPLALKAMGILKYADSLEEKIRNRKIVQPGSNEEIEIRAQTVTAMLKLMEEINKIRDEKINMLRLDYAIWSLAGGLCGPHHLTPTTSY
ncbi:MAG: hypothetical protein UX53_C0023G0009 [Candidatus Azambacteria bacterium GW2011_GWB2_46_37]|uniref:Queuosine 5'-phosphate N-glycosylase/hydrolase n=6 Tax=Candidatus Azamiibacteriota TaxID=1752741 RepID=A0A0G1SB61_9BACT|nr:MAG: hypothetical protein UX33_C0010G0005 [Candidatus Azambacteria bacterium GW2011_GWC1_46_13]KKU34503.1 MAG: hypothetical protein UX48_C0033G0005 [Candidatus Azambacteria bacterium GW2011_GWB1_46_27]KKU37010.1 MAG: hypothetical protein UX51_C0035G0005 [Candidatus Azambacteria bacterium GW2011_GWF2_46_32]KKU38854.1 MAG: hypothetical protein UX53_C0023G0009 [Candidatus Azambacteria bacterium GW2011_GWB2_46_37]KKU39318.1 MAG: hypothetical protein UX55_C0039G0005 [Candidatus Azambacteria bacte